MKQFTDPDLITIKYDQLKYFRFGLFAMCNLT